MSRQRAVSREANAGPGAVLRPGVTLDRACEGLLLIMMMASTVAAARHQGPSARATIAMAAMLAATLVQPLRTTLSPFASAVAAAWIVHSSGLLEFAWPVAAGVVWAPGVVMGLLAGVYWLLRRPAASDADTWNLAVTFVAAGLVAWMAATTLLLLTQDLVDVRDNAALCGRWLLLLTVLGGTMTLAGSSAAAARRIVYYILTVLTVGIVRVVLT